jgi:hypothetical protein
MDDRRKLEEDTLRLDRVAKHTDNLVDLVLVHVAHIVLESLYQLLDNFLQVLLVLLREHAKQPKHFVYELFLN